MGTPAQDNTRTSTPQPDDRVLHARLLAGDPVAPSELAQAHLEPLARWLYARFHAVDRQLLDTVAIDVVLAVAQAPGKYDPARARGGLAAYLRMAARRDVQNALRTERRRAQRNSSLDTGVEPSVGSGVELRERLGNTLTDAAPDPADVVVRAEPLDPHLAALLRSSFRADEWEVVRLMLEGERRTAAFARLLGLETCSEVDQAREVKRVKDRLQKRLQRLASRLTVHRDG